MEQVNDAIPNAPGTIEIAVGQNQGKVVLHVFEPKKNIRTYVPMDPANAAGIGKTMIDIAVSLGVEMRIEIPRAVVKEATRDVLIHRISLMLHSMTNKKRTPGQMAMEIVDQVLREIA